VIGFLAVGSNGAKRWRRYDFAEVNRAAADATSGAAIKPVLLLPQ
jgi:hypothetical protein